MQVVTSKNVVDDNPGLVWGEAIDKFRRELTAKHTASFFNFEGVQYDPKTDRYIAKFEAGPGASRKFSAKCTPEVADFFMKYNDRIGQWFLRVEAGVIVDVTFFDYNS